MNTFRTYGTPRVYVNVAGQYHEPLVCEAVDAATAERIAAALNAADLAPPAVHPDDALLAELNAPGTRWTVEFLPLRNGTRDWYVQDSVTRCVQRATTPGRDAAIDLARNLNAS